MTDDRQPLIEVTVPAPVEEVWAHLRDPRLIRRWFGWEYDGLPEEIDEIFVGPAGAALDVDAESHTLTWEHGDRFELSQDGEGTRLRVTRWAPTDSDTWNGIYDDIGEGWITFVQQLRFAVSRHLGEDRQTMFLSSAAANAEVLPIVRTLGLAAAAALPVGARYAADCGPDDGLTGEVWFRTERQLGVTVDQFGDGLLVVTEKPADARPPYGGAALTISTYGAGLGSVQPRWEAWWKAHVGRTDG